MKPTNVCMIAYTIYPSDARVRREAETIASQPGFQVTFLTLKEGKDSKVYRKKGVIVRELDIHKYRGKNKIKYILSYLGFLLTAFTVVNRLVFAKSLDIVHVHNMPDFLVFAAFLPRLIGKKVILDIHDSIPETYLTKFSHSSKQLLFKLLCYEESISCRIAHKIICVNHVQRDILISRGLEPDRILISMNVPDHRIFKQDERDLSVKKESDPFNLIYHGTVTRRLGIDQAIRAVSVLKRDIPQLNFYILGLGDDIDDFIELSKALGVEGSIHFNKRMEPVEKIVEMIKEMDIGVISNRKNIATELMLPVKMLEYMALAIPVVAPRLKTIQYYFDEKMIQYYEPENVDSLAKAILNLYKEKEQRRLQVQAAGKFFEVYGWEKHRLDLLNLYQEFREA